MTMGVRLFVGNLPYDTTEDEIRDHFSAVGQLSYVSIPLDRETGKKRGFAFVEFVQASQAEAAIRQHIAEQLGISLAIGELLSEEHQRQMAELLAECLYNVAERKPRHL